ncbi:MAG: 2,5-diamino-6-(ribosylamino)-4(3H)-pyrimidinone 5'-phosphate reductase, partial [Anaerolineae bacterium]
MSAAIDRPFAFINVAASADGKIDTYRRAGAMISSARDKQRVDRLRAESDAVMVGGRTLHDEDPDLTVKSSSLREERRSRGLPENPLKVGVATRLMLNPTCRFLNAGPAKAMLFTTSQTPEEDLRRMRAAGAVVHVLGDQRVDLRQTFLTLKKAGVERLMVEGGATLNFEALRLGLVDEVMIFMAPRIFGGESSPTLAGGAGFEAGAAVELELLDCDR